MTEYVAHGERGFAATCRTPSGACAHDPKLTDPSGRFVPVKPPLAHRDDQVRAKRTSVTENYINVRNKE